MDMAHPIASVADLLSDPGRAAMLMALLDGHALPAGELARIARVSPQSASGHLSKMVTGGLLEVRNGGRHRYYAIASPDVGHAVEALGVIATRPNRAAAPHSADVAAVRIARSCYDHLAGRLAVDFTAFLEGRSYIRRSGRREYEVDREGESWFLAWGVDIGGARQSRRAFALQCLDWTERRPHIAGALGAAILSRLLSLGWLARRPGTRTLRITHDGETQFHKELGIDLSANRSPEDGQRHHTRGAARG
jgi:DNA-binding transcriptional ArsR family regulator